MPSVRYYQQTAPFWDMVADFEGQGFPGFAGRGNRNNNENNANEQNNHPWAAAWGPWPFQAAQHRDGHGNGAADAQPAQETEAEDPPISTPTENPEAGPSQPRGPPPHFNEGHHPNPHHQHGPHPHRGRGRHGRCGGRSGRGWAGPFPGMGGPGFGAGAHSGGGFPFMGGLEDMLKDSLFGGNDTNASKSGDFKPEADVFDTEDSYVIHISLPGAKKEDVGVNWEAEKSELSIAGVVYRPGDEDFLKTLALDERKVGAFERKVRLGSRANPAQVDVEGITAKLEDGVLRIVVPKLNGEFVEIKKVDIE